MELRAYWQILRRRWLFVVLPAAIALLIGLVTYSPPPPVYNVGVRFIVGQEPTRSADESDEQRLANWKTSEYLVGTLADWARSGQFAALVSSRLEEEGLDVPAGAIQAGIAADDTRSMMTLFMNYGDPGVLERMMQVAGRVLVEDNAAGLPQLGGETADLVQLDEPIVNQIPASITNQLELPLRIGIAIAAGVGLAFLVDYLDPNVRDRIELEKMGLKIVGEIPKK